MGSLLDRLKLAAEVCGSRSAADGQQGAWSFAEGGLTRVVGQVLASPDGKAALKRVLQETRLEMVSQTSLQLANMLLSPRFILSIS